jgi:hypothetical protein
LYNTVRKCRAQGVDKVPGIAPKSAGRYCITRYASAVIRISSSDLSPAGRHKIQHTYMITWNDNPSLCRPSRALSRIVTITRVSTLLAQCSEPVAIGCRPRGAEAVDKVQISIFCRTGFCDYSTNQIRSICALKS